MQVLQRLFFEMGQWRDRFLLRYGREAQQEDEMKDEAMAFMIRMYNELEAAVIEPKGVDADHLTQVCDFINYHLHSFDSRGQFFMFH
jgi:hypothetical protein